MRVCVDMGWWVARTRLSAFAFLYREALGRLADLGFRQLADPFGVHVVCYAIIPHHSLLTRRRGMRSARRARLRCDDN